MDWGLLFLIITLLLLSCPIVNLIILTSKYSILDKWLVKYFSWNLKKIYLFYMWAGITAVFCLSTYALSLIYPDWFWGYLFWEYTGFAITAFLVTLLTLGLIITFKNRRYTKPKTSKDNE